MPKPLEKKFADTEHDIKKGEERTTHLESELIAASEASDGARITALGKEIGELSKRIEKLYAEWENAQLVLEEMKAKYPLD